MKNNHKLKRCAYCHESGSLTREHIIPAFLYRLHPDQKFGYLKKADRYLEYEAVVRDVCRSCNSGLLRSLDDYGKLFYEQNRCYRTFKSQLRINVRYDYEMLLRWLLKISYNAVRAAGGDTNTLSACANFILYSAPLPFQVNLLIEVIRNAPINDDERLSLLPELRHIDSLSAKRFRVGSVFDLPEGSVCRFVAINAFYFYIILLPAESPRQRMGSVVRGLRLSIPQMFRLSPTGKSREVKVSKRTIREAYMDQAKSELPAWIRYTTETSKSKN